MEELALVSLTTEMRRIKFLVPESRWYLFGSITSTERPVGDIDVLVVTPTANYCEVVRAELTELLAAFPVHLLLMTEGEELELGFIKSERAVRLA